MTVQSGDIKTIVVAAGEDTFPFFFQTASVDDVKVYFTVAGADIEQSGFTVDIIDPETGGNIIFEEPPTVGTRITIVRQIAIEQQTNYVENDPFPAETHEAALDKLTMIAQQIDELSQRSVHFPVSDPIGIAADLPDLDNRKLKFLYFDQDGQITAAEGQLIESAHTHTTFDHLTISGVFTSEFTAAFNFLTAAQAQFTGPVSMDSSLYVAADITSDGYITTTMDMSCVNINATNGAFSSILVDSLTANTFNVSTLTTDNLDVDGYILVGTDDGLKLSSNGTVNVIEGQIEDASIVLRVDGHDYLVASMDGIRDHQVEIQDHLIATTFTALDVDYDFPTFMAAANNYISAGNGMYFSILSEGRDEEDYDPYAFTWTSGDWTATSGVLMTLTESGVLTVSGSLYVNGVAVSLDGHTHEDVLEEITTVSGYLQDQIDLLYNYDDTTLSGHFQEQIDNITTSGTFYSPQVDTFYFGPPTSSGTWRFTVDDGKMKLQLYNGADWDTATSWSGVG
jgi:hypothetical protein